MIIFNTDCFLVILTVLTLQERRRGASLLDKPKSLNVQDCGSNLVFTMDEVASGWRVTPRHHQQVRYDLNYYIYGLGGI